MIARIFEFSLRKRFFVLLGALGVVIAGLWSAKRLPMDAVPDITNVQVQINTTIAALAAEEIEKQITFPIETEMQGLQGLVEMRSISRFGLSQVTLVFDEHTDIYRARQLVAERLQNVSGELPPGTQPRLAPITTGLGEVFFYTVDYARDATNKPPTRYEQLLDLRQIQEWIIKPLLRAVPGIAEVNTSGGYEKQIVVSPHPERMMSAGLSFDELASVIGENVENAGGGIVQLGGEQVTVRSVGRVQTIDEIANLPIRFGGRVLPIQVKDVADVGIGSAFRTGASTMNGKEAVVCWVLMLSGANSRVVARQAHEKLQEIQAKLPPGVNVRALYDRSELGRPHDRHRRKESVRRRRSRQRGPLCHARQLARRAHRRNGDSSLDAFCHHRHEPRRRFGQLDESRRGRFRADRRWRGCDCRKCRSSTRNQAAPTRP
jgi:cobalt-zinc-cadmium resistance protein CzcA